MYHFIINPRSQSGNSMQVWGRVCKILSSLDIPFKVHTTKHSLHATELAREITQAGSPVKLVVVGGDGFLNEVINGICYPDKVTLGYIPSGSGNDFARSLGIPQDPEKALDIILNEKHTINCNIGCVSYGENKRKFIVSSGIGFDAGVCHGVDVSKIKPLLNKIRMGKLVYMLVALREIFCKPPRKLTAILDDKAPITFSKCLFAAAMNQPYEGGGYKFCPDALCDDGLLDIFVVNNVSPLKFLYMMPSAFSGKHVRFKEISIYRCKKVVLKAETPSPVHADGEPIELQTEVSMEIEPDTIKVIVG